MLRWCRRRPARRVGVVHRAAGPQALPAEGRWQVIVHAWRTELHEALTLTRGNVEAAVALAATMIFGD